MNFGFKSSKNEIIELLSEVIEKSAGLTLLESMELWKTLTEHEFFKYYHKGDKTKIFSYLADDDPEDHDPSEVDLYDSNYIEKTRKELPYEGIGTEKYFIIAGVDGADEMAFLSSDFTKGVAILHHDYVFCSKNLDVELDDAAKELPLIKFFECLEQRTSPLN